MLQDITYQSLDYDLIIEQLYNYCNTSLAINKFKSLKPPICYITAKDAIESTVEWKNLLQKNGTISFSTLIDISSFFSQSNFQNTFMAQDIYIIGQQLHLASNILEKQSLINHDSTIWKNLIFKLNPIDELRTTILNSIHPDGYIDSNASPNLKKIRSQIRQLNLKANKTIEKHLLTVDPHFLSDSYYTTKNGRLTLPIKTEYKRKIRGYVIDSSNSKQTVYIEPEDVHNITNDISESMIEEKQEILRILSEFTQDIKKHASILLSNQEILIELDMIQAKALYSSYLQGCKPTFSESCILSISEGFNPLIPRDKCIPISIEIGNSYNTLIISGPNTGGKSITLKTIGLLTIMTCIGVMPPAKHFELGNIQNLFAIIGDNQNVSQGLSTFSSQLKAISEIIKNPNPHKLILIDEICSGTDPAEGAALSKHIIRELHSSRSLNVITTHQQSLKLMAYQENGIVNGAMEIHPKTYKPTYQFILGKIGSSNAFSTALKYGIPQHIIETAQKEISHTDSELSETLERLSNAESLARIAQGRADKLSHQLSVSEKKLNEQLLESQKSKKDIKKLLRQEFEEEMRNIRNEIYDIFNKVKSIQNQEQIDQLRNHSKTVIKDADDLYRQKYAKEEEQKKSIDFSVGHTVYCSQYQQKGTILSIQNEMATLQIGPLKAKVPLSTLTFEESTQNNKRVSVKQPKTRETSISSLDTNLKAKSSINVIGKRSEDAIRLVEAYLDKQMMSNLSSVLIIHGKGSGILKKQIQKYLINHSGIKSFRSGNEYEGGDGATYVEFK